MNDTVSTDPPAPREPRRLHVPARLAALFLVVAAGFAVWWVTRDSTKAADAQAQRSQTEALTHELAQLRSIAEGLRARQDDGETTNRCANNCSVWISAPNSSRIPSPTCPTSLSGHDALALDEVNS